MPRRRQLAVYAAAGFAVALLLFFSALLILTNTDRGRERVRGFITERIARATDGEISIGRIEGNLLRRVTLIDVRIVDSEGRPFLEADTVSTRFGFRALLRRHIMLTDLRLVTARIVLDEPPGEDWNYVRIFRIDPDPDTIVRAPGWGDWVSLRDVVIIDSRVTIRSAWEPPPELNDEERARALRRALSGETRENVVAVDGGYQNVMDFRELNAQFPRIIPAHPDSAGVPIEVARFSGIVQPFRPPYGVVRDLSGKLRLADDTLHFTNIAARLPDTELTAAGTYALSYGDLVLHMSSPDLAFADLRWLYPPLPEEGGGSLDMRVETRTLATRIVTENMDLRVGNATLQGSADFTTGDTLRLGPTNVQFARVGSALINRFVPDLDIPRPGEFTGRLAMVGPPSALSLDGDVLFDDAAGANSRIIAVGELALEPRLRFRNMRMRFEPLQGELVRAFVPQFPVVGTITGFANLTGELDGALQLDSDLTMRDRRTGVSRVRARGGVIQGDELRLRNLVVRMDPLRSDLVREHIPVLPAGSTVAGQMLLDGYPARALRLDGDVTINDPASGVSRVGATGAMAFADELRLNDMRLRLHSLQTNLLREHVPDLPANATLAGNMRLDGVPSRALRLDGDLTLDDPRTGVSRVGATGAVAFGVETRLNDMQLRLHSLQTDLLRERIPDLPAGATLAGNIRLDGVPARALRLDGDLTLDDPRTGVSRVGAVGGIAWGDELRFSNLRLRLHALQTDLLRERLPELPPGGTLTGAVALSGTARLLEVDGDIVHSDPRLGRSAFGLRGGIGVEPQLRFRDLSVRMQPLNVALLRAFVPDLPLGGTLTGTARLNGTTEQIAVSGDVIHREGQQRSHVVGTVEYTAGQRGWAVADVQLQPLSLATVGRFVPGAGLRGSVAGSLQARGRLDDLRFNADLSVANGGSIRGDGQLNLAGAEPQYDVRLRMESFDMAALTVRAPATTNLTGRLVAQGRGLDPATMNANIDADLIDSEVNELYADRVLLRAGIAGGLLRVDNGIVRLGTVEASAEGTFGLVAGRHGELRYRVVADSLHALAGWLPGTETGVTPVGVTPVIATADTARARPLGAPPAGPVTPAAPLTPAPLPLDPVVVAAVPYFAGGTRQSHTLTVADVTPVVQADPADTAQARVSASAGALGQDTLVLPHPAAADTARRLALDAADIDTIARPALPTDSLAGRLVADGVLRGNVTRFDAEGRAEVDGLIYQGTRVGRGRVEYAMRDVLTPQADITIDAELEQVHALGMSFDNVAVEGEYRGDRFGEGRATIVAIQDDATDYRADFQFMLSLDRNELRLADTSLRFDTITWSMTQPAMLTWGGGVVAAHNVEFVSSAGGRIFADGTLPVEGSGDLDVRVEDLDLAQIGTLLQRDDEMAGVLNLDLRVQGTQRAPRIAGTASLVDGVIDGTAIPEVRTTVAYADRTLTADGQLLHEGAVLATAEAVLPVDLAFVGAGQRLLPGEIRVDIRADSLPAESLPAFTDQVEDVSGRIAGDISIRGTFENPTVEGFVNLDLGTARVVPLGVRFEEIAGSLAMSGTTLSIDSLVAWSGGPVRIDGTVDVASLDDPVFDLTVNSDASRVINTKDAELYIDADLRIGGRLSALVVTGNIHTRRGVIYIPELAELGAGNLVSLDDPGTFRRMGEAFQAERQRRVESLSPLANALVEVGVVVDRDVWVRSTEANVEIYTPPEVGPLRIRMDGGNGDLRLEGSISTDRGEYEFMSRRFNMTRGAVTFVGETPINPLLQIAAEHEVRLPGREAFQIRVLLGGTPQDLTITLESTSQPPISQSDLLSYVAFGRDASSLLYQQGSALSGEGGAGGVVGSVAAIATQQLAGVAIDAALNEVERDVARELRLDVFRITPADLPTEVLTGSYADVFRGMEIEAGRYIRPRLFVGAQSRAWRPGVRVEYRTPRGYTWETALQPRFLPSEPTLTETDPRRVGVLGSFLFREWRF
jgi:translocation and assembly module TamB